MLRVIEHEEAFWERLPGMHRHEMEDELRRRKWQLVEARAWVDGQKQHEIDAAIARINAELHRLNNLFNRQKMSKAVFNLFGQDGLDAVLIEMERLGDYPYAH